VKLRALAPAKVNLCLFVGGVRNDGRHQLVTLFDSISLADELQVVTRPALEDRVRCAGVEGPNIVSRALERLRATGWDGPPVVVSIEKRIPVAAGMGGGSADAAAMLRIAARVAPIPPETIELVATELGADVPSQLEPGLAIGSGAGELVEPVWEGTPIAPHAYLIIPSTEQLSTAAVYAEADRLGGLRGEAQLDELHGALKAALGSGLELPATMLVNDLQAPAISLCPSIEPALAAAHEAGAGHAFVCGSGPTVAGLYWGDDAAARAADAAARLAERFPGVTAATPVQSGFGMPLFA
jgi:4-diphosphocytidyl-2-C-methyl-D-erythritol kinase